jgi:subtilisin family serine protease
LRRLTAIAASLLIAACGGGGGGAADPGAGGGGGGGGGVNPPPPPPPTAGPQVLVQVATGTDVAVLAARLGLVVVDRFGRRPIYRLQLPAGGDADAVSATLRTEPGVVFAEPNLLSETPEGARGNSFWAIGDSEDDYAAQWAPQALRLPLAHAMSTGTGVRVAVLDTGIVATHPAFAGRLLPGRDFVDADDDPSEEGSTADAGYGHGTHVAGLVALAAPGARIVPLRVLDPAGRGNSWVLAEALAWAVDPDGNPATDDGAHVVNMSLGSAQPTRMLEVATALANCEFDDDDDDDEFDDPGFDDDRARCARGFGAAVLSAAGNAGSDQVEVFPAAEEVEGSRAVTATTAANRLAGFANSGGWIKLAAPGEAIVSAVPGGWGTWSGTSMAAPLAAGVAALVLTTPAKDPRPGVADPLRQWTAEDLMKRLEDRSKPVCDASVKQVDAAAAVSDTDAPDPACP